VVPVVGRRKNKIDYILFILDNYCRNLTSSGFEVLIQISPTAVNPSFLAPPTPDEFGLSIEVVVTYSDGSTSNINSITQAQGIWICSRQWTP
jgi:hypothetical protein